MRDSQERDQHTKQRCHVGMAYHSYAPALESFLLACLLGISFSFSLFLFLSFFRPSPFLSDRRLIGVFALNYFRGDIFACCSA